VRRPIAIDECDAGISEFAWRRRITEIDPEIRERRCDLERITVNAIHSDRHLDHTIVGVNVVLQDIAAGAVSFLLASTRMMIRIGNDIARIPNTLFDPA